jgi:surface polysaccharide O-acyltransferase-like enzyme
MQRINWIDNLRIMVIIQVVILHSAVTYSGIGGWYYYDSQEMGIAPTLFFAFILTHFQAYFMSLLFFVSGYFSQKSLNKKGTRRFISGRFKRLGIPLLIFIFLIHPVSVKLAYPEIDIHWYLNGIKNLNFFSWTGPLWFVEALLIFVLLYIFMLKPIFKFEPKKEFEDKTKHIFILIAIITAIAFFARLFYPIGTNITNLQIGFFSAYIFLFLAGIIAGKTNILEQISYKEGKHWLILSIGLGIPGWILIMLLGGPSEGIMLIEGGMNWPAFFYALWESFFCVTFILALIGIFKHRVNMDGRFQQFLSDNAFAVFVFHTPVLVGISVLLKKIIIHPILKFVLVSILAVFATFLVSYLVRKVPLFRKIFS